MSLAYPPSLPVPFARDATAPYIREVPIASQIGIENGAASWITGFVPLNMTLKTAGGVAPFGNDTNGVLNYISHNVAWLAAGGTFHYNADVITYSTGYGAGAILQSVTDPLNFYMNLVDDNTADPDSDPTNWIMFSPAAAPLAYDEQALSAGTHNDLAVAPTVGFLDIDTTAGDVVITGFSAGERDGQVLTVSNTGPNLLTFDALTGSATENQLRIPTALSYLLNDGMTFRYSVAIGKWVKN
jgi:hypothetical protein